jgi:hypothetical protein
MRAELSAGRRVLLLGDLNISPFTADNCEAARLPPKAASEWAARADKAWLRQLLVVPTPTHQGAGVRSSAEQQCAAAAEGAAAPASQPAAAAAPDPVSTQGAAAAPPAPQRSASGVWPPAALGAEAAASAATAAHEGTSLEEGSGDAAEATGPRFVDVFRLFHPKARGAYTCWSTATRARLNNWGARAGTPVLQLQLQIRPGAWVNGTFPDY